jgi:hypothetical protein
VTTAPGRPSLPHPAAFLPASIIERLRCFLAAGLTGNVTLNVRDGLVLGARIEEVVKVSDRAT